MTVTIHIGDCRDVMPTIDADSIDAIVCDPPYGLSFMDKEWDHSVPGEEFWREAIRVAKPGAYLLAFGGTRTFHRLASAIEDAGWELRDTLMWVYGSGFPKSMNLGDGRGTALKPAWEPIVMARKPLNGTVAANVEAFGTGALNIDACRVGMRAARELNRLASIGFGGSEAQGRVVDGGVGRWPANVIHDGSAEVLAGFPHGHARGNKAPETRGSTEGQNVYGKYGRLTDVPANAGDSGSAARFFYCAKADRTDRNDGCDGLDERPLLWSSGDQSPGTFQSAATKRAATNNHPTVKPTDLMRYLCRLVTPPGGLVLDPFTGSGSTGRGAVLEGFRFVGCELSPEYAAIATARINAARQQAEAERIEREDAARQREMFA